MAVPPPGNDDSEPEIITFGIAAVDAALEDADISFPAGREDLEAAIGDEEIHCDPHGRSIRFDAALRETNREQFETRRDLLNALHPVFESKRQSGGLRGWLRAIFPF